MRRRDGVLVCDLHGAQTPAWEYREEDSDDEP